MKYDDNIEKVKIVEMIKYKLNIFKFMQSILQK